MRRALITTVVASVLALAACNTAPSPQASRQQAIADYRGKAEGIANRLRLTDYKFLGVELFRPFDPKDYEKGRSEPGGLTLYKAVIPDSAFPIRIVSVAPDGTAVEVMGLKPVGSIQEGKTYMREVVQVLKDRLPQLREYDEQEEYYSVDFLPRTQFVEWYADIWDDVTASRLERDYSRGYKSEFYYAQNKQPDGCRAERSTCSDG